MKAKMTDPRGTANPPATRRSALGKRGPGLLPMVADDAATGFPYRIKRPPIKGGGRTDCARLSLNSLRRNFVGRGQRTRLDLTLDLVQFGLDVVWQRQVVHRVPCAVVGDAEGKRSTLELAVDDVLDGGISGDVHLLQGAGDNRRVGVLLVSVDADAVHACLACRLQHAETASAGNLEQDVGLR